MTMLGRGPVPSKPAATRADQAGQLPAARIAAACDAVCVGLGHAVPLLAVKEV
ncbi:hypothetical protein KGA66_00600 [Actinocrinis puniceicyclus]|uniref:Uncharacterized protein n=1 Tax=Actinocrinis puniceicyclus TaxID=977794 RepID=A0A8J8BC89_9ACTN|nr:hypothetical protein [Actinocrinis puniceicyclus]MBS2961524.1 hypothetical protein [Actinocrinis puniceicyclus]